MLNKKNPFDLKNDTNKILESYLRDKKKLEQIKIIPQTKGLVMLIENIEKVILNGFTIIEVVEDEFNSNVSRKTIENMGIKHINMPFSNFCIKFKGNEDYKTIFVSNEENRVVFSKEDKNGILSCVISKDEEPIKKTLDVYVKESIDMILDSLSVIMYFTAFSNDKKRVVPTKVDNKNNLTKQFSKTVSIIRLSSSVNLASNKDKKDSSTNEISWIVKGHWRNQPTGTKDNIEYKIIWIDSYWKGSGKEQVSKIYKLN